MRKYVKVIPQSKKKPVKSYLGIINQEYINLLEKSKMGLHVEQFKSTKDDTEIFMDEEFTMAEMIKIEMDKYRDIVLESQLKIKNLEDESASLKDKAASLKDEIKNLKEKDALSTIRLYCSQIFSNIRKKMYSKLTPEELSIFHIHKNKQFTDYETFWKNISIDDRYNFLNIIASKLNLNCNFDNFIQGIIFDRNTTAQPKITADALKFIEENKNLFCENDRHCVNTLIETYKNI